MLSSSLDKLIIVQKQSQILITAALHKIKIDQSEYLRLSAPYHTLYMQVPVHASDELAQ